MGKGSESQQNDSGVCTVGMNLTLKEGTWTFKVETHVPEYFNGSEMASQTLYPVISL